MKLLFLLISLPILLCSGCAVASIKTETQEGKTCTGYYASIFKDIDTTSMSACGAKGSSAGSKVNSTLLQELIKAATTP